MFTIKFNAIDIDAKIVYCFYRDTSENKKSAGVERTFLYDRFVEIEPRLRSMLEGDIYSIYLQDDYTEKKSLDGSYGPLTDEETVYVKELVTKACSTLEFDELLKPPSVDDQIDSFIKEFFEENGTPEPESQKDFLSQFFEEIEDKK
jgi:hypothetical protein